MCYSAVIWADYRKYVRRFGADIGIEDFFRTFWIRTAEGKLKLPKAMEAAFAEPRNEDERKIKALIDEHAQAETRRLEQELFKQRTRLADAERKLRREGNQGCRREQADRRRQDRVADDPPEEVAAAGHDRCIVPIKPEHIDEWLNPDPRSLDRQYEILDDRQRPFYEHRLAA